MTEDEKKIHVIAADDELNEGHLCPACGVETDYRCRLCGATRTTNQVSGNIIWMRNGRIVAAFKDSLQAWIKVAEIYNISGDRWPPQFRDAVIPKKDPFEEQ